jgi:hypothetical protein
MSRVELCLFLRIGKSTARWLQRQGKPPLDLEEASLQTLIKNLDGNYVHVFSFADRKAYPESDVDAIRKQLGAAGSRLVEGAPFPGPEMSPHLCPSV